MLSSTLTAIGDPISESDLVLVTLDGLPLDYHSFVTSIENLDAPHSFSQLRAKLLTFEQRVLTDGQYSLSPPDFNATTALTTQLQFTTISNTALLATSNTKTMSLLPHRSTSSNSTNNRSSASNSKTKCQICHKFGHIAAKCHYRYSQSRNNSFTAQFAGYHDRQNLVPSALFGDSVQLWIPDSGASAYMTSDPSLIQQMQPYNGSDHVVIGDGPPHRDSVTQGSR